MYDSPVCLLMAHLCWVPGHLEGILPKGPYLPCVSMAGRALLAGYHRSVDVVMAKFGSIFKQDERLLFLYMLGVWKGNTLVPWCFWGLFFAVLSPYGACVGCYVEKVMTCETMQLPLVDLCCETPFILFFVWTQIMWVLHCTTDYNYLSCTQSKW